MRKIEEQIQESYKHMKPYLKDEVCTRELRLMCENCEKYCGVDHDYTECRENPCFCFWLAYKYADWCNSLGD